MLEQFALPAIQRVDRAELIDVPTPQRTETWVPVPHHRLVEETLRALGEMGMAVEAERHIVARGGSRYFGVLRLADGGDGDYQDVVGIRNSHDKSFVAGLACGSRVIVCTNLAFGGDIVIARKHTIHIQRDLPLLIMQALGRLSQMRDYQRQRITAYKGTFMQDSEAHDLMVRAMHEGVVAPSKLPRVLACWKGRGKHAWDEEIDRAFQYLSAWRLFNAFTYVLREATVFSIARRTQALQSLMDRAVGLRGF